MLSRNFEQYDEEYVFLWIICYVTFQLSLYTLSLDEKMELSLVSLFWSLHLTCCVVFGFFSLNVVVEYVFQVLMLAEEWIFSLVYVLWDLRIASSTKCDFFHYYILLIGEY